LRILCPGENVSDGCTCLISVKQNLETEANAVVSEYTVRYRVGAY